MIEWLRFMATIMGWAVVGRLILESSLVQPWALAAVWFIGLIWLIGWLAGSATDADYLLKLLGVPVALAAIVVLVGYAFS